MNVKFDARLQDDDGNFHEFFTIVVERPLLARLYQHVLDDENNSNGNSGDLLGIQITVTETDEEIDEVFAEEEFADNPMAALEAMFEANW